MVLVVFLYALLASTFIFAKKVVGCANPCFIIGFRMILAGSMLLAMQMFRNSKRLNIPRKDWWLFLKVALFHIYIAFIFEFWALQYVSALKTTLIYSSTPFIAALLSYFLLHERLSTKKFIGIGIGLCGLVPVILAATQGPEAAMEFGRISLPEIVLLCSVTSASYAWFIIKDLMQRGHSLIVINGTAMLVGGVLSMITSILFEGLQHPVNNWPYFLLWVFLLIFVSNIVFYNLYGWLLKRYSITFLTFSGFLCPGFGTIYEWLFMGGGITWHYPASLLLVTLGLYVFYRGEI